MSREHTITVYKFNELSKSAKVTARQWSLNGFEFDADYLVGEFVDRLKEIGFDDAEIQYSGFSCQGDGLSFTAKIDLAKLHKFLVGEVESPLAKAPHNFNVNHLDWITSSDDCLNSVEFKLYRSCHRYSHENTVSIETSISGQCGSDFERVICDIEESIDDMRKSICQFFYTELEAEYWFQASDEIVDENIIANEYEFDAEGNRV